MTRASYNIVVIKSSQYIFNMINSPGWEHIYYWDQYLNCIEQYGWTNLEFDLETIQRVDAAWDSFKEIHN